MPELSEADYRSCILEPKLEQLGYPHRDIATCRRDQGFKDYSGSYKLDYLFYFQGQPILDIEAKPKENQFKKVYGQATYYARNFEPTKAIPYIVCAAGSRIEMYKAVASRSGIGVEFQPLERILSWQELLSKIKPAIKPATVEAATETTLGLESLKMVYGELFKAIGQSRRPKLETDDEIVLLMNQILRATVSEQNIGKICEKYGLSPITRGRIEEVLGWYPLSKIEGYNLAYAYREFVTRNFTGTMPVWAGKGEKEIGRYMTPAPVIKFMVELCSPGPKDRVIDFACGSGGFLGEIAYRMLDRADINKYLRTCLFACDVDLFSVSTAQTFLELLLSGSQMVMSESPYYPCSLRPGRQISIDDTHPEAGVSPKLPFIRGEGVLNIFHHNGLFSQKIQSWEEDLSRLIKDESFDLVISNPPGGVNYNLGHEEEIKQIFPLEGQRVKLQNAPLFIQRAIQLSKDGGKICLIVPDGILANIQLQYLKHHIFETCQVKAVVSLPRGIFPNVPAKMSVIYMIKTRHPVLKQPIFMAGARTGEEYNLESELEGIWERYRNDKQGHA